MILKKLFAVLVMCVALLAATPVWAYDVYYQGEKLAKSELHFGQDCVPARAVFEKLGFDVQWRAEYNDLFLRHPERGQIHLWLGKREALLLNYHDYELPVAPYFNADTLYLPLNLLEQEYYGYKVEFLPEQQRVEISEGERPEIVYPFAELKREQLAGIDINFTLGNGCMPSYRLALEETDVEKMLALLPQLAYREPGFTDEEDIAISGGITDEFYLNFADGRTLGFGEALSMYYFFSEEDEAIAYVVWDFHKYDELVDLYKQLREKYRAQVQETLQLD